MKTWIVFIHYLLPSLIILLDQISKQMISSWGYIPFLKDQSEFLKNYGFVLGSFSHLPEAHKTFALITVLTCAIASYFCFIILYRRATYFFRAGIALMLAGVLGNSIDKIFRGYVIDWLTFGAKGENHPYFNIADLSLLLGYLVVMASILLFGKSRNEGEARRKTFINPPYQIHVMKSVFVVYLTTFAMTFIFSFSFFYLTSQNFNQSGISRWDMLQSYSLAIVDIFIVLSIVFAIFAKKLSFQLIGHTKALERYAIALQEKDSARLSIRRDDAPTDLSSLEESIRKLKKSSSKTKKKKKSA